MDCYKGLSVWKIQVKHGVLGGGVWQWVLLIRYLLTQTQANIVHSSISILPYSPNLV